MELLEIEKELAGPDKAEAAARYDAILVGLQKRLREAMRVGLPPAEYPKAEGLDAAITLARKLIRLQTKDKK